MSSGPLSESAISAVKFNDTEFYAYRLDMAA